MESIYAETIHSFANDLDNIWKARNSCGSPDVPDKGNFCSYSRFMLSASKSYTQNMKTRISPVETSDKVQIVERLAKSAGVWTRPELSRVEAEEILRSFEPGIFIVRMTTDKKTMVLTYRMLEKVQHVLIKVNFKLGFYMDGSNNIFRNVNQMIAHYMKHPIQAPNLCLKLPRALIEATDPMHFRFFESLKLDFWKTTIHQKGVADIWGTKPVSSVLDKPSEYNDGNTLYSDSHPPLPPRNYEISDSNIIQGSANVEQIDECQYNKIKKNNEFSNICPIREEPINVSKENRIYSVVWNYSSNLPVENKNKTNENTVEDDDNYYYSESWDNKLTAGIISSISSTVEPELPVSTPSLQQNLTSRKSIPNIIRTYYPEVLDPNFQLPKDFNCRPSLQNELIARRKSAASNSLQSQASGDKSKLVDTKSTDEYDITSNYAVPWDIQSSWVTRLMDMTTADQATHKMLMKDMLNSSPSKVSSLPTQDTRILSCGAKGDTKQNDSRKDSLISFSDDDDDDDDDVSENNLKYELLAELRPVIFESETSDPNTPCLAQYGQIIRQCLRRLCSHHGSSDISEYIRLFISCTIEREDLSPYTTMRLIRQYISGLKNYILQQKTEFGLTAAIEEEKKKTPKNVFINLDSLIESVLTKSVVKPLCEHIYKLLVLEHYKNNNLRLLSDGVENSQKSPPEGIGLQDIAVNTLNSELGKIRMKFQSMSKTYSPEKKIGCLISAIEVIMKMVGKIYPIHGNSDEANIKVDNILPLFVYVFSQCKVEAVSMQCEVEFIEGLMWSSRLINGEPGFYLMHVMSALESMKVLARLPLKTMDLIDLSNREPTRINPSSLLSAAVESITVIIMDEKINRLVTRPFPVRSTVNVRSLCNSIAHKLGISNPLDYCLFRFNEIEEVCLQDHEYPLEIKRNYQQKTGETVQFLFKRINANFILPSNLTI